jgi:hypothetical protein
VNGQGHALAEAIPPNTWGNMNDQISLALPFLTVKIRHDFSKARAIVMRIKNAVRDLLGELSVLSFRI